MILHTQQNGMHPLEYGMSYFWSCESHQGMNMCITATKGRTEAVCTGKSMHLHIYSMISTMGAEEL